MITAIPHVILLGVLNARQREELAVTEGLTGLALRETYLAAKAGHTSRRVIEKVRENARRAAVRRGRGDLDARPLGRADQVNLARQQAAGVVWGALRVWPL